MKVQNYFEAGRAARRPGAISDMLSRASGRISRDIQIAGAFPEAPSRCCIEPLVDMRKFLTRLGDTLAPNHAIRTPPHPMRKLRSRRRLVYQCPPNCPKFPFTGFNRVFGAGCAHPHLGHEHENGGCPNGCYSSHSCHPLPLFVSHPIRQNLTAGDAGKAPLHPRPGGGLAAHA